MADKHTLVPMKEIHSEEHQGHLVTHFFVGTVVEPVFIPGFGEQLVKRHIYDCLVTHLN